MPRKKFAKKMFPLLVCMLLLILTASWFMGGCSSEYQTASTTATPTALISAETLKAWIDEGKVNGTGYDRVVILDVNTLANYTAGHVPGAHFVDSSEIYQTRREGPANDVNMVPDGSHMNALVRKYGIDDKTTIVFTTGNGTGSAPSYLSATRAYWTFRYWGFAKERLKLLDGINAGWKAAYGLSVDSAPGITPSSYSVTSNKILRTDLRASLSEVIDAAEGKRPNVVIADFRSGETDNSYAGQRGKTAGVFGAADFTVFEGHIKGARAMNYTTLFNAADNYRFQPQEVLVQLLAGVGINGVSTALVH